VLPQLDIAAHVDFLRHPVVGAGGEVLLQAHLYLNGTSWLRSALELITRLSSTVTRRKAFPAGASSSFCAALVGTKPVLGWIAKPGMGGVKEMEVVNPASSSKLSMGLSSGGRRGQREELLVGRSAVALGR